MDIKKVLQSREYRNSIKRNNFLDSVEVYKRLRWDGANINFLSEDAVIEASIIVRDSYRASKALSSMLEKEMR